MCIRNVCQVYDGMNANVPKSVKSILRARCDAALLSVSELEKEREVGRDDPGYEMLIRMSSNVAMEPPRSPQRSPPALDTTSGLASLGDSAGVGVGVGVPELVDSVEESVDVGEPEVGDSEDMAVVGVVVVDIAVALEVADSDSADGGGRDTVTEIGGAVVTVSVRGGSFAPVGSSGLKMVIVPLLLDLSSCALTVRRKVRPHGAPKLTGNVHARKMA